MKKSLDEDSVQIASVKGTTFMICKKQYKIIKMFVDLLDKRQKVLCLVFVGVSDIVGKCVCV